MSTEQQQAEDVAEYLARHPDFLDRHPELLAQLSVPGEHGGGAIPLSERQLQLLRDKTRALESKLGELISFGEENDDISERVHRFALHLLRADDLDAVVAVLQRDLKESLNVPHVALRLWRGAGEQIAFDSVSPELRQFAQDLPAPYCGPNNNFEAVAWFGEVAPEIHSVAFIALRDGDETVGLMALGSEAPNRFYHDMGTLYLQRIGELASAALLRRL